MGIIPESVLELGRADDSSVVRAVLIQNEKAFAIYAGTQGVRLAENHQPAVKFFAMQIPLVMTIIGPDRTGLVESVARAVADHGGNWLESRMCRLGGEFAGHFAHRNSGGEKIRAARRAAKDFRPKRIANHRPR